MSHTVTRRLALGVASSATSEGLGVVQAIALVPLFAVAWGPDTYGRWLALSAVASHVALGDLGGQWYVGNLLTMHHGREEAAAFRDRLSEAVSLFLLIGVTLLSVLALGILWAAWFPAGLAAPLLTGSEGTTLLLLGANAALLSVPGGVYATVYRASGLFARGTLIGNLGRIATVTGSIIGLAISASPVTIAGWMLVSAAATTAVILIDTRRVIPACREIRISVARARAGIARFTTGSLHYWGITMAVEVNQQVVLLILAAVASPAAVAVYATHRLLASIPARVATLAQGPIAPELGVLWARRQQDRLVEVSLAATTMVMAIGTIGAAAVWALAPSVYPAWTSSALPFDAGLIAVLLIQSVLACGWQTSAWSLLATNRHHALARWSVARAAATVVLAWQLAPVYGPIGAAAAALAADLVCGALVFPARAASALGGAARQFYGRIGLGVLPALPVVLNVLSSGRVGGASELSSRAAAGALTTVMAVALASLLVLPMLRSIAWGPAPAGDAPRNAC